MKYIIMLLIILGLAIADCISGVAKGYVKGDLNSSKMRKGGIHKFVELTIMATASGFEIGMHRLGVFYDNKVLTELAGSVAAVAVFIYIATMEIISLLENYAEIDPSAAWTLKIIEKLKVFTRNDEGNKENGENKQ